MARSTGKKRHAAKSSTASGPRFAAVRAFTQLLQQYPDVQPNEPQVADLDERDARLAVAIYHAAVQRWLTLEYLLSRQLRKRLDRLEPRLQAILLTGAAQLLFLEKVPDHAVVNDAVALAKRLVRPAVGGLVNAVLRKIAGVVESVQVEGGYQPAPHRVPWQDGFLQFTEALLPPVKTFDRHLSIATSHPLALVQRFIEQFGRDTALQLLLHSLTPAPTLVYTSLAPEAAPIEPHEQPGFYVWRGDRADLSAFLEATGGWVQDPASHRAIAATADLRPNLILDYCAGRGTKTRQLAAVHPRARIIASDPHPQRYAELQAAFADHPRVTVMAPEPLHADPPRVDLIVLDVPCSNTAVLARRLEARYRYRAESLDALVHLQRTIIDSALPMLNVSEGRGAVLYATCSLDTAENEQQVARIASRAALKLRRSDLLLPAGRGPSYHDGAFLALLRGS